LKTTLKEKESAGETADVVPAGDPTIWGDERANPKNWWTPLQTQPFPSMNHREARKLQHPRLGLKSVHPKILEQANRALVSSASAWTSWAACHTALVMNCPE